MKPGLPLVFRYLDARAFLGDYYKAKKAERRAFSFRAFSRRAGLKSPNHLKRVIDGDRMTGVVGNPRGEVPFTGERNAS